MNELDPIYKELAGRLGMEHSELLARIIARLATPEQARIVRELPAPSEEIAEKLNIDKETVDRHIQELIEKALVFPTKKGPQMARSLLQLHDASLSSNSKYLESLGKEFFNLWLEFDSTERYEDSVKMTAGGTRPLWRMIPKWRAVKDIPGILPSEDVREIIKSQEVLALVPCCCKREHQERECGVPEEVCINVSRTAQYNIDRGAGRQITAEEALQVMDKMDEHPVVHMVINQASVTQLLCNCHICCCGPMWRMARQDEYKMEQGIAKSRFEAVVDPEKCQACGTCVERCQFGAAQMKYYPELGGERAYIDIDKCMGCGCCVISCPSEARSMKLVRPPEHIPEAFEGIY